MPGCACGATQPTGPAAQRRLGFAKRTPALLVAQGADQLAKQIQADQAVYSRIIAQEKITVL
ncbi:hypothetical protein H8N03_18285 [Ramlibacter sp. USB13]|uniref:Uncharacterized protein n=1 Tax=Ramlibacter cellulosilyticus TaxID=2764187 RepID=A0A923SCF0_9BURK|nr:hypothetical protein [Ramlibacter cellulosilyticus]MBC5784901.1 hypothetical protein [Ramlibacter cellulosilyticus]